MTDHPHSIEQRLKRKLKLRRLRGKLFHAFCFCSSLVGILMLCFLMGSVLISGLKHVNIDFLSQFPSRMASQAGIKSAWVGSFWLLLLTGLICVPLGVGASIYLEEFAPKNKFTHFIQLNISNLAGVPSIVYGMLGLVVFVRTFGLGRSLISAALTLALLVLPVLIIASQEAIRAVPTSLRMAALALGASRWQVVRDHVLPASLPGILTGTILALSRAIGETAPLIMVGAFAYVAFVPQSLMDPFTALPIQIFNWVSRPQKEFHELAAGGIIVLMALLFLMNSVAIWVRYKYQKKAQW